MRNFATGSSLGQPIWKALQAWGLPEFVTALDVRMRPHEPIEITCTFHPSKDNGEPAIGAEGFLTVVKRFRLVADEETEGEKQG